MDENLQVVKFKRYNNIILNFKRKAKSLVMLSSGISLTNQNMYIHKSAAEKDSFIVSKTLYLLE